MRGSVGERADPPSYSTTIELEVVYEDADFYNRWVQARPRAWPFVGDYIHPAIAGAVRIYGTYYRRWQDYTLDHAMIRYENNRRLEV